MPGMPITIEAIKQNDSSKELYLVKIPLGEFTLTYTSTEYGLNKLRTNIEDCLGLTSLAEKYKCSVKEATLIKKGLTGKSCQKCEFKDNLCYECVIKCQSQLERKLLFALYRADQKPELQVRINKDGSRQCYPAEIDKSAILTIPDFYIESDNAKLCIYADGSYWHNRNDYQALRDRSIDRELQKLGYVVLRYTEGEINKNCEKVVQNIVSSLQ